MEGTIGWVPERRKELQKTHGEGRGVADPTGTVGGETDKGHGWDEAVEA